MPDSTLLGYVTPGTGAVVVVGALQLKRPRKMTVAHKQEHGNVGDWAVLDSSGNRYFVNNEAFSFIFVRAAGHDADAFITAGYAALKLI